MDQRTSPLRALRRTFLRWLGRFSPAGLAAALVLFASALGPSLTPRGALFQGAAAGMSAVMGYGLGVLLAWVLRRIGVRVPPVPARWRRVVGLGSALAATTVVVAALAVNRDWQARVRDLMGMPQPESAHSVRVLLVSLVLALLVLQLARGIRATTRALARTLRRWIPVQVARLVAVLVVAVAVVLLVDGGLVRGVQNAMESSFSVLDTQTFEGNVPPTAAERSGSPSSAQSWDSLGREGRRFVSTGPDVADLEAFDESAGLDRQVREPIRVYAGLHSADTLDGVAANVVAELDRTDAWDRGVLVVTTTTGTGWVDPPAARAVELLWGGDTAIAAMQYSYLPSWVSFVGDRSTPVEAGRALFEAVYERWQQLPADDRPLLEVFGISLGSFGSQGAFGSLQDVLARTDGAVWAGTPGFTPLWQELTADRDPGSRQIDPVLDGGTHVRWGVGLDADGGTDLFDLGQDWQRPRVVYLQHASDGVTWWSPDLLLHRPDWTREPRGSDVLDDVRWFPVASFWQLTIDLFVAGEVPAGHGHTFVTEYADAWAAVAPPPGWTSDDTAALRAAVGAAGTEG